MSQKDAFVRDYIEEGKKTRRMLERLPFDKAAWKPHEKSSSLGALAQHIANLCHWAHITLETDELDFAKPIERTKPAESHEELMAFFEKRYAEGLAVLENTTDEVLDGNWTMRAGDQIFFTRPKKEVLREFVLSHIVHHRGQLSVYFRLLDVPVPGIFGPSADER